MAAGATGLETDVRLTSDGTPVLFHDAAVRRFGVLSDSVAKLARTQLPARIPTLGDLYATCGTNIPLSVDLKDPGAFDAVVAGALRAGGTAALGMLYLCGDSSEQLAKWREAEPRVALCRSADRPPEKRADAAAEFRVLRDIGVRAVNYRARNWSDLLIGAAHDAGLQAFAWDANKAGVLSRVVRAGIDAVYADRVPWMVTTAAAARQSP